MVYSIFCSFVLIGEKYGTGRHLKDIPQEDFVISMKVIFQTLVVVWLNSKFLTILSGGIAARSLTSYRLAW